MLIEEVRSEVQPIPSTYCFENLSLNIQKRLSLAWNQTPKKVIKHYPTWIVRFCVCEGPISNENEIWFHSETNASSNLRQWVRGAHSIFKEGFRHFLMKTSCSTSTSLYVGGIITNKPFPRSLVHKRWLNLAPYFFCSCYQRLTTLVFLSEANPTINSFNGFHFPSRLLS